MITLTTPPQVNSALGGTAKVGYEKLVLHSINADPIARRIYAGVRLSSTSDPNMNPLDGTLVIDVPAGSLEISVANVDFYRKVVLTAGQRTTVQGWIDSMQTNLESGLVSLGICVGAQTAGV